MKRYIKKVCIGIFIFICSFICININEVKATESSVNPPTYGTCDDGCATYTVEAYICPRTSSNAASDAQSCFENYYNYERYHTTLTLEKVDASIPLKYDDTEYNSMIMVTGAADISNLSNISMYNMTTSFDSSVFSLVDYNATSARTLPSEGSETCMDMTSYGFGWMCSGTVTQEWSITSPATLTPPNTTSDRTYITSMATDSSATSYFIPDSTYPGPYRTSFYFLEVSSSATSGTNTSIDCYDVTPDYAQLSTNNSLPRYFNMVNLDFQVGEATAADTSLSTLDVYDTSSKGIKYNKVSSGTNTYDVYLPSGMTSAYIDAVANDADNTTVTGGGTVTISNGSNTKTVTVTLTSDSGTLTTYTLILHVPSSVNTVTITGSPGTLGTFTSNAATYSVNSTQASGNNTMTVTASDSTTLISSSLTSTETTGSLVDTWTGLTNGATYTVTAKSESCGDNYKSLSGNTCNTTTYTITAKVLSNTKTLSGVSVKDSDSNDYSTLSSISTSGANNVYVPYEVTSVTVTGTVPSGSNATVSTVTLNSLSIGSNTATLTVTAEDTTTQSYTITVYRLSNDVSINSISATNQISMTQRSGSSYNYDLKINETNASTTISAQATHANGKVIAGASTQSSTAGTDARTLSSSWTASATTPYTFTVYAENCLSAYSSVIGNSCSKQEYKVYATIVSNDSSLSALTVTYTADGSSHTATLSPIFSSSTTEYTVNVPNSVTSVDIACTANNSEASCAALTGASVNVGDNLKTITVTAEDGTTTDYKVTVHRLSTEATLKTLSSDVGKMSPTFNAATYDYDLNYNSSMTIASITAEATSSLAYLNSTTSSSLSGTDKNFTLSDEGTFTITVYSEECNSSYSSLPGNPSASDCSKNTYTITSHLKSNSTALDTLTVSATDGGTSYPIGTPTGNTYNVTVPSDLTSIYVVGENSTNGTVTSNATNPITVAQGTDKTVTLTVTSEYGETDTYTVVVHVASSDATLSRLLSSVGTWSPAFSSGTGTNDETFTVKVPSTTNSTIIYATPTNSNATISDGTNNDVSSISAYTLSLPDDPTDYEITVSSESCAYTGDDYGDTCYTKKYKVSFDKISTDASLKSIKVVKETDDTMIYLNQTIIASSGSYIAYLPSDYTSAKVILESTDSSTTITGATSNEITYTGLSTGNNTETIATTAEDGTTHGSYTLTLYVTSNDATIASTPTSSKGTISVSSTEGVDYDLSVSKSETSTTLGITANNTNAYVIERGNGYNPVDIRWTFGTDDPEDYKFEIFAEECNYTTTSDFGCTSKEYTIRADKLNNDSTLTGITATSGDDTYTTTETPTDGTTNYTIYVPGDKTSVSVTGTPTDTTGASCATVTKNNLEDGNNSVSLECTAEDDTKTTYTINVYRVSNDVSLSAITTGGNKGVITPSVTAGTIPTNGEYTLTISDKESSVTVAATAYNTGATINDGTTNTLSATTWDLSTDPVADFTFTVYSESCKTTYGFTDSCTQQEYKIKYVAKSSSTEIDGITITGYTDLNGNGTSRNYPVDDFSGSTMTYTIYVAADINSVLVTGTAEGTYPTISNPSVTNLTDKTTTLTIGTTSEDNDTDSYTVTIIKLSDDANLKTLTSTKGSLSPAFASTNENYSLSISSSEADTKISAETVNSYATITSTSTNKIEDDTWTFASNSTYTIEVKAESCKEDYASVPGNTCVTKTYTITQSALSNSTTLDGLSVTSLDGTINYSISPTFTSTVTSYSTNIPSGTTSALITLNSGTSGITLDTANVSSGGSASIDSTNNTVTVTGLSAGSHDVVINLKAQDGTNGSYTVTILVPNNNAELLTLRSSVGSLSPSLTSGTYEYTLNVDAGTTSTVISATSPSGSTISDTIGTTKVDGATNSYSYDWTFADGDEHQIRVYAEDCDAATYTNATCSYKTYKITIHVNGSTSTDSSLSTLTVKNHADGTEYTVYDPAFVPGSTATKDYKVYVPASTTSVDIAATTTKTGATVAISNSSDVYVAYGSNTETITVTDGSDVTTYSIDVYKLNDEATLSSLTIGAATFNEAFSSTTYNYTAYILASYPSTTVNTTLSYDKAYENEETNTNTSYTWTFTSGTTTQEYEVKVYSESCKAAYASVEGNSGRCQTNTYKITATLFADKISSDTYGHVLSTYESYDIINDVKVDTTVNTLDVSELDNPAEYLIIRDKTDSTTIAAGEKLGTGMIVKLIINETEYDRRYISVVGDVNGDTKVNVFDILETAKHINDEDGTNLLHGPYYIASDVDANSNINVFDILEIAKIINGE